MSMVHQMSDAERIAYLEAQIAKLRKTAQGKLTLKVSAKGAVSVYGMGRWPVTLYKGQWERLLGYAQEVRDFIAAHEDELASKDDE